MKPVSFLACLLLTACPAFPKTMALPAACPGPGRTPGCFASTGVVLQEATLWVGHPKEKTAMAFLKIAEGTTVLILGLDNGYYRVDHKEIIGYVEEKLVKVIEPLAPAGGNPAARPAEAPPAPAVKPATTEARPHAIPPQPPAPGAYIVTRETSLRAAPDHRSKVIVRLPEGGEVSFLERTGRYWWKVQYKGRTGWAKCALLEKK